jgi:hypothetical protein
MISDSADVRLATLTKEILGRWRQTQDVWRDDKAREFDERFMVELAARVASATTNISNLERVLRKIRSDCE